MGKRFSVRKPLTLFFSKTEHRLGQRGRVAFPGTIAGSGKHHFPRRVRGGPPSPHGDGGPAFHPPGGACGPAHLKRDSALVSRSSHLQRGLGTRLGREKPSPVPAESQPAPQRRVPLPSFRALAHFPPSWMPPLPTPSALNSRPFMKALRRLPCAFLMIPSEKNSFFLYGLIIPSAIYLDKTHHILTW